MAGETAWLVFSLISEESV